MNKVKKEHKPPIVSSDVLNLFDVHKKRIELLKDNNQNNVDVANNISNYLVARNQTTEIIDDNNNQGIDGNNRSNVHVTEIIDVKSRILMSKLRVFMFLSTLIPVMLRWY